MNELIVLCTIKSSRGKTLFLTTGVPDFTRGKRLRSTHKPAKLHTSRTISLPACWCAKIPACPVTLDSWKWRGIGDWYPTRRKMSAFKVGGWKRFSAQREPWKRDLALPMQGSAGAAEPVNQLFNQEARRGGDRYRDNHCSSTSFYLFDSPPDC